MTDKTETNEVNPLDAPGDASDLPAAWEREEGANLPAIPGESALLERSDLIRPKLALIAKNGDKEGKFTPGTWVLNKEIQFTKEVGNPIQMIVLEPPIKFFQEHIEYDPDNQVVRQRFRTLEEVTAAGLRVEWDNAKNLPPTADRCAQANVLLLKPEDYTGEAGFGMALEGLGKCALASWLLANSSSYKYAARRIFTTIAMDLGDKPIRSQLWTVYSQLVKRGKYLVMVPIMVPTKILSTEIQELLRVTFNLR